MELDNRIANIMKKMEKLSTKNPEFPCGEFPPKWKAPITESQVADFEGKKGIKLPEDYRRFITIIASGGTQPFYGLRGLFDKEMEISRKYVGEKFPFTVDAPFKLFEMSEEEYEAYWDSRESNPDDLYGQLALCDEGCGMESILIVNTDDEETYGTVWFYDLSNDFGIMPIINPRTCKPMHFLDWLEYYVDKTLELPDDDYFSYGELTVNEEM